MKKTTFKQLTSLTLAIILLVGCFPMAAFAEETPVPETCEVCSTALTETTEGFVCEACTAQPETCEEPEIITETVTRQITSGLELPDNEELFGAFVERELYGYDIALSGTAARAGLNTVEKSIYDALKAKIEYVALHGGSTEFALDNISGLKTSWTNKELTLTFDNLWAAFEQQFDPDCIIDALLADCPFDLYWYDKTIGASTNYSGELSSTSGRITDIKMSFYVAEAYQGSSNYSVTTNVDKVTVARATAEQVVADNRYASDYETLLAFKNYICNAVSYNYDAAEDDSTPYGNPWQLIYVFDNNSTTNVVCEGYSKAFQYLCDLAGLDCISVSGTTNGPHMWNVVTLGGKKYLVDVTNSDSGTIGSNGSLFLAGAPYQNGKYTFDCGYGTITYSCDNLGLATSSYDPSETDEYVAGDFIFKINNGKAKLVSYTGHDKVVTIPSTAAGVPVTTLGVHAFQDNATIEKVTFAASIVEIENGYYEDFRQFAAFANCVNLKAVVIPDNSCLTYIGNFSFFNCKNLIDITLPDSIKELGLSCFECCESLTEIQLPEGLEFIRQNAFTNTSIKSLHLPASCTHFNYINRMPLLESFTVAAASTRYRAHEGVLYDNQPPTGAYSGWTLINYPISKPQETYRVADYCTHIFGDTWAMEYMPTYLETLYIGNAVSAISGTGKDSFSRIECYIIPDSTNAHYKYKNGMLLSKDGKLLAQVARIGRSNITVPDGVEKLEGYLFWYDDNLTRIILPSSVKEIDCSAFSHCDNLTSIIFQGDCPKFTCEFEFVTFTMYYPEGNPTWKNVTLQTYYSTVKLESYSSSKLAVPAKPYKIANVVSGIHVYWKTVDGAVKYGLWRSETGVNGEYKWVANPTVPHFTDTKAESGKTYHYKVTAMNNAGIHTEKSPAIGIAYVYTPDITSRVNTAAGVKLGWEKIEGATGYAIYRKAYEEDAWTERIVTISGNETFTWTDESVKNNNGIAYKYTIRALAGSDMKTLSGCRNAGRTMVRLSSQVLKSAAKASAASVKCSWTTSSRVTGYEVRFLVDGEVFKTFTVGNYKTGIKTFTGLEPGQTYTVQVRTYKKLDGVGSFYSDWSSAKAVKI